MLECDTKSNARDDYFMLHIPIWGDVSSALKGRYTPEELKGDTSYECQTCGRKTLALKRTKSIKTPLVLLLHVLRYSVGTKLKVNVGTITPEWYYTL